MFYPESHITTWFQSWFWVLQASLISLGPALSPEFQELDDATGLTLGVSMNRCEQSLSNIIMYFLSTCRPGSSCPTRRALECRIVSFSPPLTHRGLPLTSQQDLRCISLHWWIPHPRFCNGSRNQVWKGGLEVCGQLKARWCEGPLDSLHWVQKVCSTPDCHQDVTRQYYACTNMISKFSEMFKLCSNSSECFLCNISAEQLI